MEKGRKQALKKVPTRKLLASIKKDLRKITASATRKKK
jgi:hypothetical protein